LPGDRCGTNENYLKQLVTDEVQKILGRPVEPRTVPRLEPPVEDVVVAIGRALEWRPRLPAGLA
jgi:hypothetical protein